MESRFGDGLAPSPFAERNERKEIQTTKIVPVQTSKPEVIVASPQSTEKRSAPTETTQESNQAGLWLTTAAVGTAIVVGTGVAVGVAIHSRNKQKKEYYTMEDGERVDVVYDQEYGGPLKQEDEDF